MCIDQLTPNSWVQVILLLQSLDSQGRQRHEVLGPSSIHYDAYKILVPLPFLPLLSFEAIELWGKEMSSICLSYTLIEMQTKIQSLFCLYLLLAKGWGLRPGLSCPRHMFLSTTDISITNIQCRHILAVIVIMCVSNAPFYSVQRNTIPLCWLAPWLCLPIGSAGKQDLAPSSCFLCHQNQPTTLVVAHPYSNSNVLQFACCPSL